MTVSDDVSALYCTLLDIKETGDIKRGFVQSGHHCSHQYSAAANAVTVNNMQVSQGSACMEYFSWKSFGIMIAIIDLVASASFERGE